MEIMSKENEQVKTVPVFVKHMTQIKIGETVVTILFNKKRKRRAVAYVKTGANCHVTWENAVDIAKKPVIDLGVD